MSSAGPLIATAKALAETNEDVKEALHSVTSGLSTLHELAESQDPDVAVAGGMALAVVSWLASQAANDHVTSCINSIRSSLEKA